MKNRLLISLLFASFLLAGLVAIAASMGATSSAYGAGPEQQATASCVELLADNSFEIGGAWQAATFPNVGFQPDIVHSGDWAFFISTFQSQNARLWQAITVPMTSTTLTLTFFSYAHSLDAGESINAVLYNQALTNAITTTPIIYDAMEQWQAFTITVDAAALAGQNLQVAFDAVTDADAPYSEVSFDDVNLMACDDPQGNQATATPTATPISSPTPTATASATPTATPQTPIFTDSGQTLGADATYGVVSGDLDQDGDLDLVVANFLGVSQVLRNDHGQFSPVADLGQLNITFAVTVADLDNDGDLDIVLGQSAGSTIWRNEGDLTFRNVTNVGSGGHRAVAAADLDGDGDIDLVTGSPDAGVAVWRNDGNFVFSPAADLGQSGYGIALGDLDGDGDLDVWVADQVADEVWRNDGALHFTVAPAPGGSLSYAVALGDLDGDGDLDAVTGRNGENLVWRNTGALHFTEARRLPFEDSHSVALGDVDADGRLDILFGNASSGRPNQVYRNDGDFIFAEIARLGSSQTFAVALADVDADSDLDIVAGNASSQPNRIWVSDGGGLFSPATSLPIGRSPRAVGDMDNDGRLDLALAASDGVKLFRNTGATFSPAKEFGPGNGRMVTLVDLDGDHDLDLAVALADAIRLWRNDGQFNFSEVTAIANDAAQSMAFGDLDADGDLDLFAANSNGAAAAVADQLWRNDGNFQFAAASALTAPTQFTADSRAVALGDLDQDGDLDAFVATGGDQPDLLWRNDGAFHFVAAGSLGASDGRAVALADLDGDDDLDAYVANSFGQADHVWFNDGAFTFTQGATLGGDWSLAVALGDVDGDGDVDALVGNDVGYTIWQNPGDGKLRYLRQATLSSHTEQSPALLADLDGDGALDMLIRDQLAHNRAGGPLRWHTALGSPGLTAAAPFFATAEVIQQPVIDVPFTLFSAASKPLRGVKVYYSLNNGGAWLPATPADDQAGGDLATAPNGVPHIFRWQADADLVRHDNVHLRIESFEPLHGSGPYQYPYAAAESASLRVEPAAAYVKVVDGDDHAVAGAQVYRNAKLVTTGPTDRAGLARLPGLRAGDTLAARALVYEQASARPLHDDWAYRIYQTNIEMDAEGNLTAATATAGGAQRLILRPTQPLILFNLLISIEWDANQEYVNEIARAASHASDYLLDVTDGQMAFGQVTIYDQAQHWSAADLQISTKNIVRPHAYIGGLLDRDTTKVMRVGRAWDGSSGSVGPWDAPDGFRTWVHEFGHYAFQLYDEYTYQPKNAQGQIIGPPVTSYCTDDYRHNQPANDEALGSIMSDQYHTSEFSARGVTGLWATPRCEFTLQWQAYDPPESTWETIMRVFADGAQPARWQLTSPLDRHQAVPGPTALPPTLLELPQIQANNSGSADSPAFTLTVRGPDSRPFAQALVALYKTDYVIEQGLTDSAGKLVIYGAEPGNTIHVLSVDGAYRGMVEIAEIRAMDLTLQPVISAATLGAAAAPRLRLIPSSSPGDQGDVEMALLLSNFDATAEAPSVLFTPPGGAPAQSPTLSYSPTEKAWKGGVAFSANARGDGKVQVAGFANGQATFLHSTYLLQSVPKDQREELYADDGNLRLLMEAHSFEADTFLAIAPPGTAPGSAPPGYQFVGDIYDLTASGATAGFAKPAALWLYYDDAPLNDAPATGMIAVYRWDALSNAWRVVPSVLDAEHQSVAAMITLLGAYTLLVDTRNLQPRAYLPLIYQSTDAP